MEAVACLSGPQQDKQNYTNATSRKCSNFKAETSAHQTAVAYIAEMKPHKTVILTDSKAALQSLISNTSDQPILPPHWPSGEASALRAEDPGSNPACAGIFLGSSHTSDLKIGTPVATLPGAWRYRVSTGTGRPSVSILWLGEMESLVCNFYLSVAARKSVWADPFLRYNCMLLRH